ncbi:MAG: hypothetical protein WBG08_08880 [Litorimonas sp.]
MPRQKNAFVLGIVVGGFVWLVMDSLFFGFLAAAATGLLISRDNREDEDGGRP